MQIMSHPFLLGTQISLIIFVWGHLNRNVLDNLKSVRLKSDTFYRIVGKQPHFMYAERTQYLRTHTIVALIGIKAKVQVGIYRVESLFL